MRLIRVNVSHDCCRKSCFLTRMKHICSTALLLSCALASFASEQFVYFGTYTGAKSKGIYVSRFDSVTGKLSAPELAVETKNPSFLTLNPTGEFLYAAGEMSDAPDKRGAVSSFKRDPKTGKLTLMNQQRSGGSGPCHLSVDASGKTLLVANFGSGSIASLPVKTDGSLGWKVTGFYALWQNQI